MANLTAENQTLGAPGLDYTIHVSESYIIDSSGTSERIVDITSSVPGLFLCGPPEKILAEVPQAVAVLREANGDERPRSLAERQRSSSTHDAGSNPAVGAIESSCSEMGDAVRTEDGGCSRPICPLKAGPAEVLPAVCGSQTAGSERAGGQPPSMYRRVAESIRGQARTLIQTAEYLEQTAASMEEAGHV